MPALAAKRTKNKQTKNSNQWKKQNFVLIQNDIPNWVIFLCLQAKLQLFQDCSCCSASNWEIFLAVIMIVIECFIMYCLTWCCMCCMHYSSKKQLKKRQLLKAVKKIIEKLCIYYQNHINSIKQFAQVNKLYN